MPAKDHLLMEALYLEQDIPLHELEIARAIVQNRG